MMRNGTSWEAEKRLNERAEANLGLFTKKDWRAAGLSDEQLKVRRRRGIYHRIFNNIFAVAGAPRTIEFRVMAGVLRAAPLAAGFGATAAYKHGWMKGTEPIHIGSSRHIRNEHPGYRFHRVALSREEICIVDGVPVTDPLRTLIDAAAELHPMRMATMYQRAKRLEQFTDVEAAARCEAEARQGRDGICATRSLIASNLGDFTRLMSDLEGRFIQFLQRWGFPPPLRNILIDTGRAFPWRPDFYWPRQVPVVIELQHYSTHGGPVEWQRDHDKAADFKAQGMEFIAITNRDLDDEPKLAARLGPYFDL